jgi:hypothetical protein
MKKNLLITCLFVSSLLIACDSSTKNKKNDSLLTDTHNAVDSKAAGDSGRTKESPGDKEKSKSPWTYEQETNKMNDSKIYFASVISSNQLSLSSPYDGENWAHIQLRAKEGANDVILSVDKGQFMTGVEKTNIRVRFDKNPPESFSCSTSSDDDSKVLFISSAKKFIKKLKKSKSLLIEANMYQDGNQQLNFETDSLKWDH